MSGPLPRISNHAGKFRIMIREPNWSNYWATYIEDEDDCVIKFQTKQEAENYLKKYLKEKGE